MREDLQSPLAARLRELRQSAGLSLRQVERATGVSNSYLSQLETGSISRPSPHILQKVASCYGGIYEELMQLTGYVLPSPPRQVAFSGLRSLAGSADLTDEEAARVEEFIRLLKDTRPPK